MFRKRHIIQASSANSLLLAFFRLRGVWLTICLLALSVAAVIRIEAHYAHVSAVVPPESTVGQGNDLNYSTFKHTSSKHASLGCSDCHKRPADNSIRPVFPYHPACISCHGNQFLTPNSSMCTICHSLDGSKSPSKSEPLLKGFPTTFKESFNLKFDHSQHMSGSARPRSGCVSCHNRPLNRGAALSIPAGPSAHGQCYTCHTPGSKSGAGREIASCGVCHELKKYGRTSTNSRAFRQAFSHAQHSSRQRLECASCHTVSPGVALGRQVSSTRSAQHFAPAGTRSCASCHDGQKSFGGDLDFKGCRRCHAGTSFRFAN